MEALINHALIEGEIVRRYITPRSDEKGQRTVHSLARIDFETFVKTLHHAAIISGAITQVKENAADAIGELRTQLREAHERKGPVRDVPPPIEGEMMPNR